MWYGGDGGGARGTGDELDGNSMSREEKRLERAQEKTVLTPKSFADKNHQFILTKPDIRRRGVGGARDGWLTGDAPDIGKEGAGGREGPGVGPRSRLDLHGDDWKPDGARGQE